jgi:hypothetical protein
MTRANPLKTLKTAMGRRAVGAASAWRRRHGLLVVPTRFTGPDGVAVPHEKATATGTLSRPPSRGMRQIRRMGP